MRLVFIENKTTNLSRVAFFSATVIGGTLENLMEISKGIVLESFTVNFFSAAGVSQAEAAEDDDEEELDDSVLVSGTPWVSSEDDPPPKNPFSLPSPHNQ